MTTSIPYLDLIICASLGQFIHLVFKWKSLKEKARVGNTQFTVWEFLHNDFGSIAVTAAFVAIVAYQVEDVIVLYPKIANYLKGIFSVIGYSGSDFALRVFSRTSAKINHVIDEKTNIADGIQN